MGKNVYFSCCATYHLTVALYYSMVINWGNSKKILIWQNRTYTDVDLEIFKEYFDIIIEKKGFSLEKVPFLKKQIYKIINGGWLFALSDVGKLLRQNKEDNILFVFNDMIWITDKFIYEFAKYSNNKIILIDEGVGTYCHVNIYKKTIKEYMNNIICGQKYENYIGANKNICTVIAKDIEVLPEYQILNRKIIRQNLIFNDYDWICQLDSITKIIKEHLPDNIKKYKKVILWVGNPLAPEYISKEKEKDIIDQIFSRLGENIFLIIKRHPRETKGKYIKYLSKPYVYDFDINGFGWIPVELLINLLKPDVVMSPVSSALINISSKYKSIFCYELFDMHNISHEIKKLIQGKKNKICIRKMSDIQTIINKKNDTVLDEQININEDIKYIENLL